MANIWYIQVNRYCNNSCHFCSNPSNGKNITYERWIKLIDNFIKKSYRGIIFTGWEPTLSPDLWRWILYTKQKWIENRIISNGMKCSDYDFMKRLSDNGLELVHFSVFSCYEQVHDFLSNTPWSWKKLMRSIANALKCWVRVQINTVINHYNQSHLDKTVIFLTKHFPQIQHFVWNNLDPEMMRKTDIAWSTLPDYDIFKNSLTHAMKFLESRGKTFRAEKVPLCYLNNFEYSSTETRKIVKNEERIIHFLDFRETIFEKWENFFHEKPKECNSCSLTPICAGIYEHKKYYSNVKVYPRKLSKTDYKAILMKIYKD